MRVITALSPSKAKNPLYPQKSLWQNPRNNRSNRSRQYARPTLQKFYRGCSVIEGQTAPLEIARRILKPETIREVRTTEELTNAAYLILDRWALNSPELLRAWDKEPFYLLQRLGQQMFLERHTLNSDEAWEMSRRGMSDWEILELLGVDTELRHLELI
jgi:hypothetical protein